MPIVLSGSLELTGSVVATGNFTTAGNITAQTLVVQTITSSINYITGSSNFGSLQANRHTFTGSFYQTGSIAVFSGCVGIGTISPTRPLFVNGSAFFDNAGEGNTTNPSIAIGSTTLGISYLAGSSMALIAGGAERLRLESGGDIRINMPNSTQRTLSWYSANGTYQVGGIASCTHPSFNDAGYLIFSTAKTSSGGFTEKMRIEPNGAVGIGTTSISSTAKLAVCGTIESLTDSGGEGGQVMLRGTCYQYGLDNYTGCAFRIFREDDGTGSNGLVLMSVSKCGNIGLRTNQSMGATDNYGSIANNSFTTFNINGAGGDNSIGFIAFGARRLDANCGAVRMWAQYHTAGANGYSSILGRDEGGIFISNTQSGVECIINCSGGSVCYSIRYISLMSASTLAGI